MQTVEIGGHRVVFDITTGQVAGAAARSETHTSGGGGGGYVSTGAYGKVHGSIAPVSISSYSVQKLDFWLKRPGEPDHPVNLSSGSEMIAVMDGQTVSLVWAQVEGTDRASIVRIINHDAQRVWPWIKANKMFPTPKQPPMPSLAPVWAAWVGWVLLAMFVPSGVSLILGVAAIGVTWWRQRQRKAVVLYEFAPSLLKSNLAKFERFEQEADRLAQEVLQSVR